MTLEFILQILVTVAVAEESELHSGSIFYSARRASIGLTVAALRAGSQAARLATANMIVAHKTSTKGSATRVP
jgi:uncharacterized protein YhbP (UPF0306 family)